jgi:4-amino-4-deoxy-L-arabinose transferase-like glycosyltransferase
MTNESTTPELRRETTRFNRRDVKAIVILLIVCFGAFFFKLGAMALWDQDEGMHAATSREMVETGDWITTRFNGENFYDKPVFYNWFVSASFVAFGFTEFAARLPSALFGLATVLFTFWIGRSMFNRTVGLLAGAVLATSIVFIVLSRIVLHDIALTATMTLAFGALYCASEDESRRSKWWLVFYAAMALAVLAKGPVGAVLPGGVGGVYALVTRRPRLILDLLPRPLELIVFLVVAAPWYVTMSLLHDDYFRLFILEKNFGSFLGVGDPSHAEPFHYFFWVIFGVFFPWSVFLPMALLHGVIAPERRDRRPLVFLLLWFVIVLLFFSVATSKLASYIVPLAPAAALLIGYVWHDLLTAPYKELRRGFMMSWVPLVLIMVGGLVALFVLELPDAVTKLGLTPAIIAWPAGLAAGGTTIGFVMFLMRRSSASFWWIVVSTILVTTALFGYIGPKLDGANSTKVVIGAIDERLPEGEPIPMIYKVIGLGDTALFYTNRKAVILKKPAQIDAYLRSDDTVYCLMARRHAGDYVDLETPFYVVADSLDRMVISNQPVTPGDEPVQFKTFAEPELAASP